MNKKLNYLSLGILLMCSTQIANARENVGNRPTPKFNPNKVAADCNKTAAQTDLDFNNIRTRIFTGGDMWWDLVGAAQYEIPKGTGKHSLFAGSVWVGGYDANGNLKVAAQTYRQSGGNDFYAGPLSTSSSFPTVDAARCQKFDRHWRVTKDEVIAFVNEGVSTKDIREWPGNGDVANGELQFLAPFEDVNANGVYEYGSGDYPRYNLTGDFPPDPNNPGLSICDGYIYGDKTLWWVFNDVGGPKTETGSQPIGLEIRAQAFAFKTNDEINNMTFYKYQIINRSSFSFDSTYFGQWADPDLGDYNDDYVGCDVGLGLGFVYNGDADDGSGTAAGYGFDPPALGIDFFQGPLADYDIVGDGIDNDGDGVIDDLPEGDGIDNDKDGTIDEPGEQIIMSKFVYYENDFTDYGNPEVTDDYYQYLTGSWKNGDRFTRDGLLGRSSGFPVCDYLFPGTTDPSFPVNWTEVTAGNVASDRRFLQSAGEFTLKAGAVNFITTGALWARATSGGPEASVALLKVADEKAQALFNNCFKTLDGPDAPDVAIRELDRKLVLSLQNAGTDKVELYDDIDPAISYNIEPDTNKHRYYFQGYQIYQFKNNAVTTGDLDNPDLARLIYQIDRKDNIDRIVNWAYNENVGGYVPTQETFNTAERGEANQGLKHTFVITEDAFATADKELINHKAYYFTVISYAYNNYLPFEPVFPPSNNTTQQKPFLAGRNNIKTYTGIPHNPSVENGGQVLNVEVGGGVEIKRIEGQGNGGVILDMKASSREEALTGPNYTVANPVYEAAAGPLNIKVYDPTIIEHGHFTTWFDGVSESDRWRLKEDEGAIDTSDFTLGEFNEQVLVTETYKVNSSTGKLEIDNSYELGLTADINSVLVEAGQPGADNNAFLDGTLTFANGKEWLTGVPDTEGDTSDYQNWIRSGDGSDAAAGDLYAGLDDDQVYEKVIGGTWAPFKLCGKSDFKYHVKYNINVQGEPLQGLSVYGNYKTALSSVDIVITSDKSKWSRCPVVETGYPASSNYGAAPRFTLRREKSVDKQGVKYGYPGYNVDEAGLVSDSGMGWFPGYAVNLETGERLNLVYGENSQLGNNNGTDMVWNPTSAMYDDAGIPIWGGMHFVYVIGHNADGVNDIPKYDDGTKFYSLLKQGSANSIRNAWIHAMWTSIPLVSTNHSLLEDDALVRLRVARKYKTYNTNFSTPFDNTAILNEGTTYYVTSGTATYNGVNFNAGTTFTVLSGLPTNFTGTGLVVETKNGANPMYEFSTDGIVPETNVSSVAKDALSMINVVPNPYYAYSSYETKQNDSWVKITNLPSKCKVSIYTMNGTLIRSYSRDVAPDQSDGAVIGNSQGTESGSGNYDTSLDWDLNNDAGVPIASGVYLIHIEAPGLGERTLKWFGVLRPIDLDSY